MTLKHLWEKDYEDYLVNQSGSNNDVAMLCYVVGRHLVTLSRIERSTYQWNGAHYPEDRSDEVSLKHKTFINARKLEIK
ncbi:phosphoribosylformylglycinamidine synthase subunit PurQ [Flavobacterium sp. PL11]|uniref:phosphoribosylformylglycinamidine synthase subunit PurQ n=1 Tax=Flavobacterium sp. PL11 TaxID=3071717 RepID=UPI002E10F54B